MHASSTGAVKLAKIDPLPRSQDRLSLIDDQGHRRPHQARFDMGIGITLGMAVFGQVGRRDVGQARQQIAPHAGIGVLIDGYGRGGSGYKT